MPSGWLEWDWGNVPAWVGSLLTGSSLAVAAVTYVRNAQERRRENADRARSQAALVSSWPVNARRWQVRNGNEVAVTVQAATSNGLWSERVTLAPGETRALRVPPHAPSDLGSLPLLITDSFGHRWMRTGDGELAEVSVPGDTDPPPDGDPGLRLTWDERG